MTSVMLPNLRRQPEDDDGGTPPMQPPALPPEVHDATQDHAAKRALNTASMISLDPQQPDYQDKLANHVAHGELLNAAHENTVNKMQMPVYGGPSKEPVPQGQPIPAAEMPQDVHKFQVSDLKNKIAEAERRGDHAAAGQARMALASEIRMNPLGSEANHPGVMGKIGHVLGTIGNVVGNATIGPQNMSLIPGSQANLAAREAGGMAEEKAAGEEAQKTAQIGEAEARTGATKAQQAHTEEETRQLQNKPESQENLQQEYTDAVMNLQAHPDDPVAQQKVQQLRDAITSIQKEPAEKTPPHIVAMRPDGKPHTMERDPTTGEYSIDRGVAPPNFATIAPELKGMVPIFTPDPEHPGGYIEQLAKPGSQIAPGALSATGVNQQNLGTTLTRNAAYQARLAHERVPEIVQQIQTLGDKLGPVMGRWNEFMQGRVGASDPDLAELRTNLMLLSSRIALMHAYGRLPENLREQFDRSLNALQQTPENLVRTIQTADQWAQDQMALGANPNPALPRQERGGATPPATGPTKPAVGAMPSFAEWKQKQQQGAASAR